MSVEILTGDAVARLREMPAESVHCAVTSPPYWGLRAYLPDGHPDKASEIGTEDTPEQWAVRLVEVFREVRRVLRSDGVFWLNVGDALRDKQLLGLPWRLAFALQADGWWLRSDTIWSKPNPMPESVSDRPTKSHEYVFMLTKSPRYFFDQEAVREPHMSDGRGGFSNKETCKWSQGRMADGLPLTSAVNASVNPAGRNIRSVWNIATEPLSIAHFAAMPTALARRCILAGTSARGCCPDCGAPWARLVERERDARPTYATVGAGAKATSLGKINPLNKVLREDGTGGDLATQRVTTTGWRPTCTCPEQAPVPCRVLDPFGGSGTTAVVADELGRDCTLIELSPDYAELARKRIERAKARRALGRDVERIKPIPGQLGFFT